MSQARSHHAADSLAALPDVLVEISSAGKVTEYVGGGGTTSVPEPGGLPGPHLKDFLPETAARRLIGAIRKALRNRRPQVLQLPLGREGNELHEVRLFVLGRDRVLAVFRSCDEGHAQGTDRRSLVDTLTGMATRERLLMELEGVLAQAKLRETGVALMCVDIDRFTRINEALGRAAGDEVLRIAARRIESSFREADQLVRLQAAPTAIARIGGDEFVLILDGVTSREEVSAVSGRIARTLETPVSFGDHGIEISPSIGIAIFPQDGSEAQALLDNARSALDHARDFGASSGVFYSATAELFAVSAFDFRRELLQAIDRDQLELHYQPRIDLESGTVTAMEALLRWNHPVRGFVPLDEVLPLAEATGLMESIGQWALATASAFAARLAEDHTQPPIVSLNLSQHEFARADLPQRVADALERTGLPGKRLQLEFTEAALMRNRRSGAVLRELDAQGVHLALDDFGTGHVSLADLSTLPIGAVKIDRVFVEGLANHASRRALCSGIVALARELDLVAIAEGVETEAQANFLTRCKCHAAQGFFYSRPLPDEAVSGYLRGAAQASSAGVDQPS